MTLHYAFNKNYKFEKEPTWQTVYEQLQDIQDKIWKNCMIWDVLDWINVNIQKSFTEEKPVIYDGLDDYRQEILYKWIRASKPLNDQSPETIKAIWEIVFK